MSTCQTRPIAELESVSRRQILQAGVAAATGAAMCSRMARASESAASGKLSFGRTKHVVHIYLHGGAPTQDMWDLKPNAPVEIRGEFKPVATSASGIQICEHLPKTAKWMHKAAIVRSVHHRAGCHNCLPSFTGSEQPVDINLPVPLETNPPGMGAICEYLKPAEIELPHYVALPTWLGWGFILKRPGPWGGFLGSRYDPLQGSYEPVQNKEVPKDRQPVWVGAPKLAAAELPTDISIDRLGGRRELLTSLNAGGTAGGNKAESVRRN
ncbi:MAG TPA: DUF1501 domain-containing protein, partial [Pirellulaceae bacterium]|nr:DUF1501 domain-containing protein [Pirellulaceae bacterium]